MSAGTNTKRTKMSPWLTQKELAKRWHVSPSSIINWRNKGRLPYFRVPGSARILYPLDEIVKIECQNTTREVQRSEIQSTELKRKKPVVSAKSNKKWRI